MVSICRVAVVFADMVRNRFDASRERFASVGVSLVAREAGFHAMFFDRTFAGQRRSSLQRCDIGAFEDKPGIGRR